MAGVGQGGQAVRLRLSRSRMISLCRSDRSPRPVFQIPLTDTGAEACPLPSASCPAEARSVVKYGSRLTVLPSDEAALLRAANGPGAAGDRGQGHRDHIAPVRRWRRSGSSGRGRSADPGPLGCSEAGGPAGRRAGRSGRCGVRRRAALWSATGVSGRRPRRRPRGRARPGFRCPGRHGVRQGS
jgi:hypothetical protein